MSSRKGPLKPEDNYKVTSNYDYIIEQIDAADLTSFLFSKFVLTIDDKKEIDDTKRRDGRNEILLQKILRSGPGEAYNHFVNALRKDYDHVANKLESVSFVGFKPEQKPYSWFETVQDNIKNRVVSDADLSLIASCIGNNWEILMHRLGATQIEIERERAASHSDALRIIRLLIKWRQRVVDQATVQNLIGCLVQLEDNASVTIDWERLRTTVQNLC